MRKSSLLVCLLAAMLFIIAGCGDSSSSSAPEKSNTSSDEKGSVDQDNKEEKKKDEPVEETEPSKPQSPAALSAEYYVEDYEGKMNSKGIEFALNNADIFLEHKDQPIVDLEEPKLMKNPNTYGESFISISGTVIEANEEQIDENNVITVLQIYIDETETVYQAIYDGSVEIYAEDQVKVDGIIAGIIRDETMGGYTADFPVIISNKVTK